MPAVYLAAKQQAKGCLETIKACNSKGIAHPAEALMQKQDGLRNSTVRLKDFTEAALQRGRNSEAAVEHANTDSDQPQPAPFEQPTPK